MNTILLDARDPQTPAVAAELIRRGRLVAIPTETVYGLGADGLNPEAVAKIFEAKGRPGDNPLILHVTGPEQLPLFCHHIPDVAYLLAERFWPGPSPWYCLPMPASPGKPQAAFPPWPSAVPRPMSPGKSYGWPAFPSPPPQPISPASPPPPQPSTCSTTTTGALTPL